LDLFTIFGPFLEYALFDPRIISDSHLDKIKDILRRYSLNRHLEVLKEHFHLLPQQHCPAPFYGVGLAESEIRVPFQERLNKPSRGQVFLESCL
jgi:hypothetical protein